MPAIALFRGPYHVMEYANEEVIEFSQRDGRGIPVREAFTEERWAAVQAAMDRAFTFGEVVTLTRPLGTLVVRPRRDDRGRVVGVGTYFEADPVEVAPLRHPSLHPLAR